MLSQIHLRVLVSGDAEMFLFAVDICLEELVPVGMKDTRRLSYKLSVFFLLSRRAPSDFARPYSLAEFQSPV